MGKNAHAVLYIIIKNLYKKLISKFEKQSKTFDERTI